MTDTNHDHQVDINAADSMEPALIAQYYDSDILLPIFNTVMTVMQGHIDNGLSLPYFVDTASSTDTVSSTNTDNDIWQHKPKAIDVYITNIDEGRALNLDARGKDYATNILSYPSELPASVIEIMPTLPLGELIICHEVMVREAAEQHKTLPQHITHLLIHGTLHLLGFDHELGQAEQDEMEAFEIEILANLNLPNPYV